MTYNILALLLLTILVETAQQVFFKMAGRNPGRSMLYSGFGIIMYLAFLVIWLQILKTVPLGIALPLTGLNYAAVAIAGYLLFKEKIGRKTYAGIALILMGFTLVWYGGGNI